ncbi:hypothetical protein BC628DRAFT_1081421 [Trametes gibbosa]|nr:hypothetical protein BC628DRAFT_1081421 [Trametes gibbosa]
MYARNPLGLLRPSLGVVVSELVVCEEPRGRRASLVECSDSSARPRRTCAKTVPPSSFRGAGLGVLDARQQMSCPRTWSSRGMCTCSRRRACPGACFRTSSAIRAFVNAPCDSEQLVGQATRVRKLGRRRTAPKKGGARLPPPSLSGPPPPRTMAAFTSSTALARAYALACAQISFSRTSIARSASAFGDPTSLWIALSFVCAAACARAHGRTAGRTAPHGHVACQR